MFGVHDAALMTFRIPPGRAMVTWLPAVALVALVGCSSPAASVARPAAAAPTTGVAEPAGAAAETAGDEPNVPYVDSAQHFRFDYPVSWGKSTPTGEAVRVTGRDEFISIKLVPTTQAPLDFAKSDVPQLTAASPGYRAGAPKTYSVAGANGAMVAYTWQAGPSPVTGKAVPSTANRYYIPGPNGQLAVLTYSSPTPNYDPAGADDFANSFRWLP
jgi:hypothetical protein